jgi:hypothetical protein
MSSTINSSPDRIHHEVPAKSPLLRVRKPLLICGIAASLLYGAMIWVISYPGTAQSLKPSASCPHGAFPRDRSGWFSALSMRRLWSRSR